MAEGGSVVGLTFDARFAWPVYDWMGVAKAAFESTNRYLARDLGPEGDPVQHRRGGPDPHHGRQVHPGLRALRGGVGHPCAARLGRQRRRARGPGLRRPALRLVPRDDRRDGARRRRLPRDGRLSPGPRPGRTRLPA